MTETAREDPAEASDVLKEAILAPVSHATASSSINTDTASTRHTLEHTASNLLGSDGGQSAYDLNTDDFRSILSTLGWRQAEEGTHFTVRVFWDSQNTQPGQTGSSSDASGRPVMTFQGTILDKEATGGGEQVSELTVHGDYLSVGDCVDIFQAIKSHTDTEQQKPLTSGHQETVVFDLKHKFYPDQPRTVVLTANLA